MGAPIYPFLSFFMPESLSNTEGILDFLLSPQPSPSTWEISDVSTMHFQWLHFQFHCYWSSAQSLFNTSMSCSIMHTLLDSPVFEWKRSCLLTCDFEGKCRKKRRKKNKRKNSPVRIQLIVAWQNSSIHFLLTTTYFWSWSQGAAVCPWGRGRNTVWTVYQSCTSWVIYYNRGVQFITLPRISNKQTIWRY